MTKETVAPEEQPGQPAVVIQNSDLPELQPKVTPVINQGNARKVTGLVELELGKETGAQNIPLTEHDDTPQGQKSNWPWEKALARWMGTDLMHRQALRETMRSRFSPGPQALYTPDEWRTQILSFQSPYKPKAEIMVQLLAVILQTGPGNPKKKKQLDLSEVCASIRCQKSEQACLEMATIFDDYLDDLDFEPTSKAFARLYNIMDDSDEEWPVTPVHIKPISQRKMYKMLALLDLTLGNEIKLRHGGGGFSTFSLGERTRRLSVNLQEYERNQGLFGVAVKTGGTVGGPALDPLTEETGSDADSKPPDAFITDVDKSLPPSRPGSTSSRPGSTTSKREVSSALRRPQQGNKKLNSLFAIDKYDPVWVKAAKLTLLEDEFKEMVMEDVLLLKCGTMSTPTKMEILGLENGWLL